MSKTALI